MGKPIITWEANEEIVASHLTGSVEVADVHYWEGELRTVLARLPDGTRFSLLSDLAGYEPANLGAHRAMRSVIPLFLTAYGFRTGLIDIVGAVEPVLSITRGISCIAVAHIHHDAYKMALYEDRIGRATERFFTDISAAYAWLRLIRH